MHYVNPEYVLSRQIAYYLRAQYPKCFYHFDPSGLSHTKAQAGMMKALQPGRGYPDLFICEPKQSLKNGSYHGLFIELKPEGAKIYKKDGTPATPHLAEQLECLLKLKLKGYQAAFGIGFENTKKLIDDYLNNRL
jgi:hypothetical protein